MQRQAQADSIISQTVRIEEVQRRRFAYVTLFFEKIIPWPILQDLFVHEYGIITLGVRYAVAIILPIVGIFFLVFSVMRPETP